MSRPESLLTNDQRAAIGFLEPKTAAGFWGDCGVGKTAVLLTVLQRLLKRFDVRRVLVVAPRLVAESVWTAEVAEWEHLHGLRVSKIVGTAAQRLRAMEVDADIYTITRDNVVWLEDQFLRYEGLIRAQYRRWPWDCVVVDESQSFKAQSSQRFKSLRRLRRLFPRIYLATGSLMPNGARDLWSQVYLLDGGERLGKSEAVFLNEFFTKEVNDGIPSFTIKPDSLEKITARISDIFFVLRDAQPAVKDNFIFVDMTKAERTQYSKMVRTSVLEVSGQQVTAVNAGVLFGKLAQLANGALYHDAEHNWTEIHRQKLDALVELLESLPRPLLIGYSFIHDIERIQAALKQAGVADVGVIRTAASLDEWKAGRIKVGIIHPLSAGHGLNQLKNAEAIVWFGLSPSLESYQQLNGRVIGGHRRAGRDICVHHILARGTVDEDIREMLNSKDLTQSQVQIRVAQRMQKELA